MKDIILNVTEMFDYLSERGTITERPYRRDVKEMISVPKGRAIRQLNGWLQWKGISRIREKDGTYTWYELYGAKDGRAARHIIDSTTLILESAQGNEP